MVEVFQYKKVLEEEYPYEVVLDPEKMLQIYKEVVAGAYYIVEAGHSNIATGNIQPEEPEQQKDESGGTGEVKDGQFEIRDSWAALLNKAVSLHRAGAEGNKEAVKEAYDLLIQIREQVPENNIAQAYYGSTMCLLGRDAIDPVERFNKAVKGLKILDKSVAADPENVEIRMLRAKVSYRLPDMYFHRTETAIEDLSYLAARFELEPDIFSQDTYCQALYELGDSYKRTGRFPEAETTWRKLLSADSGTKYAELLEQEGFNASGPAEPESEAPNISPVDEKPLNENEKEMLAEGIRLHQLALEGDKESLAKAISFFEKALAGNPDDPRASAYHADCISLMGREASNFKDMFGCAHRAINALDSAVNSSPDDVEIRTIRARQSLRLPEALFHRTATALTDFEYLIRRYEEDSSVFPPEKYLQALYSLGEAYRRLGLEEESRLAWDKLLSLSPGPEYQSLIEKRRSLDQAETAVKNVSPDSRVEYYQEGFRLHGLAVAGSKPAAKAALDLWQKAFETDPRDAVAQAYLGSCLALVGRDSGDPQKFFGHTIKGLIMINRAVEQDCNNLRLRVLRAYLKHSLPSSFLQQTGGAVEDFHFLKMCYELDSTVFSEEFYHQVIYNLGAALLKAGETQKAIKVWEQLLQVSSDPRYKHLLNGRLETGYGD